MFVVSDWNGNWALVEHKNIFFSCTSHLDRVCLFPTSMIHNGTHVWPYSDPYNLSIYNNHIKTVYGTQWNTCGISLTLCRFVNNHISMMNTRYIGFDGYVIPNAVLKYQKRSMVHTTQQNTCETHLLHCVDAPVGQFGTSLTLTIKAVNAE